MFRWTFPQLQSLIRMRGERMQSGNGASGEPEPTGTTYDLKKFFK